MVEIHNVEASNFIRLDEKQIDVSYEPEGNNKRLQRIWEMLAVISHGTLSVGFNQLYSEGGMFMPAYDMEGELGQKPPQATIQAAEVDLEMLFPAFKSVEYKGKVRPATLGIYSEAEYIRTGNTFVRNFPYLVKPLAEGNVYGLMKLPGGSPLMTKYETSQEFRENYFEMITGEDGWVHSVTENAALALVLYKDLYVQHQIDLVHADKLAVQKRIRMMPDFAKAILLKKLADTEFPTIEDTLK